MLNAIRSGIAATMAPVVVITMADLSDDLGLVPEMVRLISSENYDIVCASRYMAGGSQLGGPPFKRLLSCWAGLSLHWLTGLPTHDATNAFRAYRRDVLLQLPIESRGGFEYSLEITARAFAAGRRITEVPGALARPHGRKIPVPDPPLAALLPSLVSFRVDASSIAYFVPCHACFTIHTNTIL